MKVVVIKSPKFLSGILRIILKSIRTKNNRQQQTERLSAADNRKDEGYELDTGQDLYNHRGNRAVDRQLAGFGNRRIVIEDAQDFDEFLHDTTPH